MTTVQRPQTAWLDHAAAVGVAGIAQAVLDACAQAGGVRSPHPQGLLVPEPTGGWANPRLLGWVHEWSATGVDRTRRGAYYTPPDFAADVVDRALDGVPEPPAFVVDPACGGGVFLLEILDRLRSAGIEPADCVRRIAGIEIDSTAAATTRQALQAWQLLHGVANPVEATIAVMDSLDAWPSTWPQADLIVGNPPFASPLKSGSIPESAQAYRSHHSEVLGPYADLAAIHLWRATQVLAEGGRLAFVAPVSIVNARDTGRLWRRFEAEADAVSVLIPASSPFEASVRVFVPVFEIRRVDRSRRRSLAAAVAEAIGLPTVDIADDAPTLGSIASATSGFRDEFYGLAEHVREAQADLGRFGRLVTVGSIEPLECSWGVKSTKFAKAKWDRPVVVRSELNERVGNFVEAQMVPKVLVATQTKVLEPVVDPVGDLIGVTPTIIVTSDQPAHVAAMLLAPAVNAIAVGRWFGTGLSETALRPTASTLLDLPLPTNREAWDEAAELVQTTASSIDGSQVPPSAETLIQVAELMQDAYGGPDELIDWWRTRAGLLPADGE